MKYVEDKLNNFINEMAYTRFDKEDDVLPKELLDKIQFTLGFKRFKRIGSGIYGTAFRVSNTKVFKISKDLKEYDYANRIIGLKNEHIADVYKTYHFINENEEYYNQYVGILKEYCNIYETNFDKIIDKFLEYTGNEMSLSYLSSEFLGFCCKRIT